MDDGELKAEVARAEADRDLARQALARTRELIDQQASSQADLERAEATARSTRAQYDLLSLRLARTTVRAPFSGVVGQRFVSVGDYLTTSTRLASLQTVHPQRAAFQVPERYAAALKVGQRVVFRVAALPGKEYTGVVDFVDPVVQLPGRTITVKAEVANPKRELQAGMFIDARLATAVRPNAVVIPEDAILPIQGSSFVWVAKDGRPPAGRSSSACGRRAGWRRKAESRRASQWSWAGRSACPRAPPWRPRWSSGSTPPRRKGIGPRTGRFSPPATGA